MSTMMAEEEQTLLDLSNELEDVTGRMRRAVIDMVHRARDKIHEAAAKELDLRRKQAELEQQQLIEQLDNMQALNVKHIQKIEDQQDFCDKVLNVLFNLRGRRKEKDLLRRCLRSWHSILSRDKWVDVMGDYLLEQRNRKTLRRILGAWRNDAGRTSRERRLENITTLHDSELSRVKADSDLTISSLKVELLGCKDTIARGNEERAILEERLKAAVMRGMCALNAEATMVLRGMAGQMQISPGNNENMPPPPPPPANQQQQQQQQQMMMNNNNNPYSSQNPYNYYQQPQQQQQNFNNNSSSNTNNNDQLLNIQSQINSQLGRYVPTADGLNASSFNNNNNNSSGNNQNMTQPPPPPSSAPLRPATNNNTSSLSSRGNSQPQQQQQQHHQSSSSSRGALTPTSGAGSTGTTGGTSSAGGLVSFNTDHPAYRQQQQQQQQQTTTRSLTASNRSTPHRR